MMEGLTARFTFRCLALEGLWIDMVTSLVGGPMEALATKVEDGKSQVEEQGQASSNFNKLVIFGLEAVNREEAGRKIAQQMKVFHIGGNMVPARRFSRHCACI